MDFRAELTSLLEQVPAGRVVRCADLARSLGDVRASAAVFRFLRDHPGLPGAHRVVTERGRPVSASALQELRREGLDTANPGSYITHLRTGAPLAALRREQLRLAARVSRRNGFRTLRTIGGVDVSYSGDRGFASLVVLRAKDLAVTDEVRVVREVTFPYIPTYLAYREFPLIEEAFRRLREPPTLLLVDGHGQLHPARCGIACMVGVRLGVPTIGVAKNPLVGTIARRPKIGESVPVRYAGEIMGYALRASPSIKPLYVSTGHRVAPRSAVRIVKDLCRTRHPEPLRLAHARATEWKIENKGKRTEESS